MCLMCHLQLHAIVCKVQCGSFSVCPVKDLAVSAMVLKDPVYLVQATEVELRQHSLSSSEAHAPC